MSARPATASGARAARSRRALVVGAWLAGGALGGAALGGVALGGVALGGAALGGAPPPRRLPAEFEPTRAVALAWRDYPEELAFTADAVARAGAEVWVVGGPPRLGPVPAARYRVLPLEVGSPWIRDFGPVPIVGPRGLELVAPRRGPAARRGSGPVAREDDVPCGLAALAGAPCTSADLALEGGNLAADGHGTLFTTVQTYEANPGLPREEVDRRLGVLLGVTRVHAFDYARRPDGRPADGTGHLDMFFKLLAPCTALVAQTADEPFAATTAAAAARLRELRCPATGGAYEVVRIPGWWADGAWHSHTNALLVNGTVVLPAFRGGDTIAASWIYRRALPGARVVPVFVDRPIRAGGGVHCLTATIPRLEPRGPGGRGTVVALALALAVALAAFAWWRRRRRRGPGRRCGRG